jgi:hypothetical protein
MELIENFGHYLKVTENPVHIIKTIALIEYPITSFKITDKKTTKRFIKCI